MPLPLPNMLHKNLCLLWRSTTSQPNGGRRVDLLDTLGIEPKASRMLSGCATTTPRALESFQHSLVRRLSADWSGGQWHGQSQRALVARGQTDEVLQPDWAKWPEALLTAAGIPA